MNYFVIGMDGNRYGPVDLAGLVRWTREGRVIADTRLVDAATGREFRAIELGEVAQVLAGNNTNVRVERGNVPPREGSFDPNTGTHRGDPVPVRHGPRYAIPPTAGYNTVGDKSKVAAGILGILFGSLGAHRFYMGYMGIGLLQLLITLASCVIPFPICGLVSVWGLVEGILCLTGNMRDAQGKLLRD